MSLPPRKRPLRLKKSHDDIFPYYQGDLKQSPQFVQTLNRELKDERERDDYWRRRVQILGPLHTFQAHSALHSDDESFLKLLKESVLCLSSSSDEEKTTVFVNGTRLCEYFYEERQETTTRTSSWRWFLWHMLQERKQQLALMCLFEPFSYNEEFVRACTTLMDEEILPVLMETLPAFGMTIQRLDLIERDCQAPTDVLTRIVRFCGYQCPMAVHTGSLEEITSSFRHCDGAEASFVERQLLPLLLSSAQQRQQPQKQAAVVAIGEEDATRKESSSCLPEKASVPLGQTEEEHDKFQFEEHPVYEALLSSSLLLDKDSAIAQALSMRPDVLQEQYEPFLTFCQGNAMEAAQRLARYWELRIQMFGREAALSYSRLELSKQDKKHLQEKGADGAFVLEHGSTRGRPILLWNQWHGADDNDDKRSKRLLFYVYDLLMDLASKGEGDCRFEALLVSSPARRATATLRSEEERSSDSKSSLEVALVQQVLCVRFVEAHVVVVDDRPLGARRELVQTILPKCKEQLKSLLGESSFDRLHVPLHLGSQSEVSHSLQAHGILSRKIPQEFGGSWSYQTNWKAFLNDLFATRHQKPRDFSHAIAGFDGYSPQETLPISTPPPPFLDHAVHSAMSSFVAPDAAAAYLEATERAPQVVIAESPHDQFWDFCSYNANRAAERLACYWTLRLELFGRPDGFSPVSELFGRAEKGFFKRRLFSIIPNLGPEGSLALVADRTRTRFCKTNGTQFARNFWFCLQKLSKMAFDSGKSDVVYVLRISSFVKGVNKSDTMLLRTQLAQNGMCVRFAATHLLAISEVAPQLEAMAGKIAPKVMPMLQKLLGQDVPQHLHAGSLQEVVASLESHGFDKSKLLMRFGGAANLVADRSIQVSVPLPLGSIVNGSSTIIETVVSITQADDVVEDVMVETATMEGSAERNPGTEAPGLLDHPVHQAILDIEEKDAYMEAMTMCPDLIARESPHDQFLKFCTQDVNSAAERLACYWTLRVEIFGRPEAFSPASELRGEAEKALFARGILSIIPNCGQQGCPVLVADRTKSQGLKVAGELFTRAFWLCLQELSMMAFESGSFDAVYVTRLSPAIRGTNKGRTMQHQSQLAQNCMCVRFIELHVVALDETKSAASGRVMMENVAPIVAQRLQKVLGQAVPQYAHAGSLEAVLESLGNHALDTTKLRPQFGGATGPSGSALLSSSPGSREMGVAGMDAVPTPETETVFCTVHDAEIEDLVAACVGKKEVTSVSPLRPRPRSSVCNFLDNPVHKAMQDIAQKDEYMEATVACPDLVARESPPDLFLAFCEQDASSAAERLACYWTLRVEIFGRPEGFSPASELVGEAEEQFFSRGILSIVPRCGPHGAPALVADRTKSHGYTGSGVLFTRAFWLCLQRLSMMVFEAGIFDAGAVYVARLSSKIRGKQNGDSMKTQSQLAQRCMCIRFNEVHVVALDEQETGASSRSMLENMAPFVTQRLRKILGHGVPQFTHGGSLEAVLDSLAKHGLDTTALRRKFSPSTEKSIHASLSAVCSDPTESTVDAINLSSVHNMATRDYVAPSATRQKGDMKSLDVSSVSSVSSFQRHPVHQAMKSVRETAAYTEAVEACPELVSLESPHDLFLAFCDQDTNQAAARLSRYWTMRVQLFGRRHAFLPMSESVGVEEQAFFAKGALSVIPDCNEGCPALFACFTRGQGPHVTPDLVTRAFWFRLQTLSELAIESGSFDVVYISNTSTPTRGTSQSSTMQLQRQLAQECMCVRFVEAHIVAVSPDPQGAGQGALMNDIVPMIKQRLTRMLGEAVTQYVHSGSVHEVLDSLQRHGFDTWKLSVDERECSPREGSSFSSVSKQSRLGVGSAMSVASLQPFCLPPRLPTRSRVPPSFADNSVHRAMESVSDSRAYMIAVEAYPELVSRESPHDQYFAFCNRDNRKAAERLARYWTLRLEIFGEWHGLLPLAQGLNQGDKALLSRGVVAILPNGSQGRPVLFADRSRIKGFPVTTSLINRVFWFRFQILSEMAFECGNFDVVNMACVPTALKGSVKGNGMQMQCQIAQECMCVRFVEAHFVVLNPPERGAGRVLMESVVKQRVSTMIGQDVPQHEHSGSLHEVMLSLQMHGFDTASLPTTVGGEWTYEKDWRGFLEERLPSIYAAAGGNRKPCSSLPLLPRFHDHPVHQAIKAMSGSACYLLAVRRCPDVISLESPHDQFLKFCRGDARAAASRLSVYWNLRVQLFGPDAGYGALGMALSETEKENFRRGAVAIIEDKHGRENPVLFVDRSRIDPNLKMTADLVNRSMWFRLQSLSDITLERGDFNVTFVTCLSGRMRGTLNGDKLIPFERQLFQESMCLQFSEAHLVGMEREPGSLRMLQDHVAPVMTKRLDRMLGAAVPKYLHFGSVPAVLASMRGRGLDSYRLPSSIGGSWQYDNWIRFLDGSCHASLPQTRAAEDRKLPAGALSAVGTVSISRAVAPALPTMATHLAFPSKSSCPSPASTLMNNPVHKAMTLLGPEETSTYRDAFTAIPNVVQEETPFSRFLSHCNQDCSAAARRLAKYWTLRRQLFGGDQLSLSQALSDGERKYLFKGVVVTLPPKATDGSTVLFVDRTLVTTCPTTPLHVQLRSLWYCLHTQDSLLSQDIILVCRVCNPRLSAVRADREVMRFVAEAMSTAWCFRLKQVHFVSLDPPRGIITRTVLAQVLPMVIERLSSSASWSLGSTTPVLHVGSSEEVLASLKEHGFGADGLPVALGGTWRTSHEWLAWLARHGLQCPESFATTSHSRTAFHFSMDRRKPPPTTSFDPTTVDDRKSLPTSIKPPPVATHSDHDGGTGPPDGAVAAAESPDKQSAKKNDEKQIEASIMDKVAYMMEARKMRRRKHNEKYTRKKRARLLKEQEEQASAEPQRKKIRVKTTRRL